MYCPKTKVLFVHIPKCAGQTIAAYFLTNAGLSWDDREQYLMQGNDNPKLGPPQVAHFTLEEYYSSEILPPETIYDAIKFTVVRNPWARLWSEYNFNWRSICEWDDFFDFFPTRIIDCHETGRDALRHIKPQVEFIEDGIEVLRFENLDAGFSDFCQRHDLPDVGLHNKMNMQNTAPYQSAYNERQIEIVGDFYRHDIEMFDYKF